MYATTRRTAHGYLSIRVEGYPERLYAFYSKREAVKKYREEFGLKGKKLDWIELVKI